LSPERDRQKAKQLKRKKGHPEVDEVVKRLIEAIEYCDCSPSPQLAAEMTANYLPGFATVLNAFPQFWGDNKEKILLMAGLAGAIASMFAVRDHGVQFLKVGASGPEVETTHAMMAMGVVRSACRIGLPPGLDGTKLGGLPCNRKNLPLTKEMKEKVVRSFAEITVDLLTND
jgi:hypothetical protein